MRPEIASLVDALVRKHGPELRGLKGTSKHEKIAAIKHHAARANLNLDQLRSDDWLLGLPDEVLDAALAACIVRADSAVKNAVGTVGAFGDVIADKIDRTPDIERRATNAKLDVLNSSTLTRELAKQFK